MAAQTSLRPSGGIGSWGECGSGEEDGELRASWILKRGPDRGDDEGLRGRANEAGCAAQRWEKPAAGACVGWPDVREEGRAGSQFEEEDQVAEDEEKQPRWQDAEARGGKRQPQGKAGGGEEQKKRVGCGGCRLDWVAMARPQQKCEAGERGDEQTETQRKEANAFEGRAILGDGGDEQEVADSSGGDAEPCPFGQMRTGCELAAQKVESSCGGDAEGVAG